MTIAQPELVALYQENRAEARQYLAARDSTVKVYAAAVAILSAYLLDASDRYWMLPVIPALSIMASAIWAQSNRYITRLAIYASHYLDPALRKTHSLDALWEASNAIQWTPSEADFGQTTLGSVIRNQSAGAYGVIFLLVAPGLAAVVWDVTTRPDAWIQLGVATGVLAFAVLCLVYSETRWHHAAWIGRSDRLFKRDAGLDATTLQTTNASAPD